MVRLVTAGGALVAGIVAVPAAITALSPVLERRRHAQWLPLGPLEEFPLDDVLVATVQVPPPPGAALPGGLVKAVFVWRPTEDEVVVYSRNCTDLSCPLTWDRGSGWFYCPCHGGIFTIEGEPVAGPPDRPMYRYATRIRGGVLEIDVNSLPPMT